jgi:hypothetical protein
MTSPFLVGNFPLCEPLFGQSLALGGKTQALRVYHIRAKRVKAGKKQREPAKDSTPKTLVLGVVAFDCPSQPLPAFR